MTTLLKGERYAQVLTGAANTDTVVLAFDLPAGSVLKRVSATLDLVGVTDALERENAINYALAMYLVPLDDPDTAEVYDAIWDRFVPKYTDVDSIDLDTVGADTTPFWEPGEADFESVFDMGNSPLRMYMRRKRLDFADPGNAGFRFQPAETPFEPQWIAGDIVHIRTNKSIRIRQPSIVMIGVAQPLMDDTSTLRPHLTEIEWGQIQYVEATLERALMDQIDNVEAGATVTWETASAVLRKHLAPDVFEATANAWKTETFNIFAHLTFEHTVPGTMAFDVIDITP